MDVLGILTYDKHFPKTVSKLEFDHGWFTKLPGIIVARDFSPNSLKFQNGILPPLTK